MAAGHEPPSGPAAHRRAEEPRHSNSGRTARHRSRSRSRSRSPNNGGSSVGGSSRRHHRVYESTGGDDYYGSHRGQRDKDRESTHARYHERGDDRGRHDRDRDDGDHRDRRYRHRERRYSEDRRESGHLKGVVRIGIRVGDSSELEFVLPIGKVVKWEDMLGAVDALLHDLLSAGDIPISFGNLQTPSPGKWKLTDTSGAIINRMFWSDLCVDGASYKVVSVVGAVRKYELPIAQMPPQQAPPGVHPARALQMNPEEPDSNALADVMSFVDNYLQKPAPPCPSTATNTNAIPINMGGKKPYVGQQSVWDHPTASTEKIPYTSKQSVWDYPMANTGPRASPSWSTQRSDPRHEPVVRDLNPMHQVQQRPRAADSFYASNSRREDRLQSPSRHPRLEKRNSGSASAYPHEGTMISVVVRNEDCKFIRTVKISLDDTVHQLMSEHLHLKYGSRIQHVVFHPKDGWRNCLSYMYGTRTLIRNMPLATLGWNWAKESEINIAILRPVNNGVLPFKVWYAEVVRVQEREMEKILGPVSYKTPAGLFSGNMDLDVDTRVKTESAESEPPHNYLSSKELEGKLKDAMARQQKPESFQLSFRPQSATQSKSDPVPQVVVKQEPELEDVDIDMDFGKITREVYGDEMSQRQSRGVRISTPEIETEGMEGGEGWVLGF